MLKKLITYILLFISLGYANTGMKHLELIQLGIDKSIEEEYETSLALFDSLIQLTPSHPAGYFFKAAAYQSKMMDFETEDGKDEFYDNIEKATELSEHMLKNYPESAEAHFFLGAARSYHSYQLARDKKYFSAIRKASSSIDELEKCLQLDETWYDAYLGIGSYKYWRSYLTRKFTWLPFFSDKREQGIENLLCVQDKGTFTRWAALSNLAWIYIEEKEFEKAIDISQKGLDQFPDSRFFLWPLGDASLKAEKYNQAIDSYKKLLASVSSESINNHYNEIVLNLKLGQCYKALDQDSTAISFLNRAIDLEADEEIKDRAREKKEKAAKILGEINRDYGDAGE